MTIKNRTIVEEYRELTKKIAVVKSSISTNKREIDKLIKSNLNIPSCLGAIDYTKPAVQTSLFQGDLVSAYIKIHDLEVEQQELEAEKQSLYDQRDELEKVINGLGDREEKAMMLRIKGFPNWKIAKEMNYSQRRVEQIFKEIREKQKDYGEISV